LSGFRLSKAVRRGGALTLPHPIGGLTASHRTGLEKLVFSADPANPVVGIGNENDQAS